MNIWAKVAACVWAHSHERRGMMGEAAKLREPLSNAPLQITPSLWLNEQVREGAEELERTSFCFKLRMFCSQTGHKSIQQRVTQSVSIRLQDSS